MNQAIAAAKQAMVEEIDRDVLELQKDKIGQLTQDLKSERERGENLREEFARLERSHVFFTKRLSVYEGRYGNDLQRKPQKYGKEITEKQIMGIFVAVLAAYENNHLRDDDAITHQSNEIRHLSEALEAEEISQEKLKEKLIKLRRNHSVLLRRMKRYFSVLFQKVCGIKKQL